MVDARKHKLHIYVLAEAVYQDRLDDSVGHQTQAEWEIVRPAIDDNETHLNGMQTLDIGRHNCADEECPKE